MTITRFLIDLILCLLGNDVGGWIAETVQSILSNSSLVPSIQLLVRYYLYLEIAEFNLGICYIKNGVSKSSDFLSEF